MSHMFGALFTKSPLLALPVISLVLFIAIFAGVVYRVWRRGAAGYVDQARLPLDSDGEDRHE